jgi:hypothetical protein
MRDSIVIQGIFLLLLAPAVAVAIVGGRGWRRLLLGIALGLAAEAIAAFLYPRWFGFSLVCNRGDACAALSPEGAQWEFTRFAFLTGGAIVILAVTVRRLFALITRRRVVAGPGAE